MKKWQCTVCGYIHEGDAPPDECPVCGADSSQFVEITEEAPSEADSATLEPEPTAAASPRPETVEPPEARAAESTTGRRDRMGQIGTFLTQNHAHPIATHIPNGVLPVSVLFLLMSVFFHFEAMGRAAFYNMVVVFLAMPFVIAFGWNDWQRRLGGRMTNIILTKMICGGIVLVVSFVVIVWWAVDPTVATAESSHRWLFLFLNLINLAAAAVAGYQGGKLVFSYNQPLKK